MSDMPDGPPVRNSDIQSQLNRIEDKIDRRLTELEVKVDAATSRLDRMEGGLSMLRWLGPTGVIAVIIAVAQSSGLIR